MEIFNFWTKTSGVCIKMWKFHDSGHITDDDKIWELFLYLNISGCHASQDNIMCVCDQYHFGNSCMPFYSTK